MIWHSHKKGHSLGTKASYYSGIPSSMLKINGYDLIRNDRTWHDKGKSKKGGGICTFIKNILSFSDDKYRHLNTSTKNIESQWISLNHLKMSEIVIINLYRPPKGDIKEFIDKLNCDLSTFDPSKKREFYIMGDFNIDSHNRNDDMNKELNSLLNTFGLKPFISETTRFGFKNSCLDNIYSNSDIIQNSGTLDWNFSDHQAVFINRKKMVEKIPKMSFIGRSYKNYNKEDFQEKLRELPWNDFFGIDDPNVCWSIMIDRIISVLDTFCPEEKFNISE